MGNYKWLTKDSFVGEITQEFKNVISQFLRNSNSVSLLINLIAVIRNHTFHDTNRVLQTFACGLTAFGEVKF
jgi:hypothetical protein